MKGREVGNGGEGKLGSENLGGGGQRRGERWKERLLVEKRRGRARGKRKMVV